MKLIDADKLINLTKEMQDDFADYVYDYLKDDPDNIRANNIIDLYNELVSEIGDQPTVSGWISCKEKLPENLDPVNVTWVNHKPVSYYDHIKDVPFTATAHYYNGQWFWYSCNCEDLLREYGYSEWDSVDENVEIIAWIPLPKPYKGE